MTKHSPIQPPKGPPSLLERAAQVYDFGAALRGRDTPSPLPPVEEELALPDVDVVPAGAPAGPAVIHPIDRVALAEAGFQLPGGPVSATGEEVRIVKRALLRATFEEAPPRNRAVLVTSAHPGDGKSWCAVNLALSLAAERDLEVVLVDADVAKPGLPALLGLPGGGPGLLDAIADPAVTLDQCLVQTDMPSLRVLPAGRQSHADTELLAAARTRKVIERLGEGPGRRIVLVDSSPALATSSPAVLAGHVGQVLMVVRADRTHEQALRDALALLQACPRIALLLNGVRFRDGDRLFGTYYRHMD
jgi:Mrp family chromosome partitioning ATPase